MKVQWIRVIAGALLLEVVLVIVLVPLSLINTTLFLVAVPIGVFGFGYLVSWWLLRRVPSRPALHGALIGMVATALYMGLVVALPGGYAGAVATYGVPLFWFCQAMRMAGCVAGAARHRPPGYTAAA